MNSEIYMDMKRRKCREKVRFSTLTQQSIYHAGASCSLPVLGFTTILTLLPAMIYGCTVPETTAESVQTETAVRLMETCNTPLADAESIDILVFNDDRMQKLDTYQRFDMSACSSVKVGSTAGDKTIAVIVNSRVDRYYWAGVTSRNDMKNICFNLEDETRDNPSMSGEYRIRAGSPVNLKVERLYSEIELRSLSCDFKGKGYEGEQLRNVKVYLTNVNAEAPAFNEEDYIPRRIINNGRFNPEDLESFKEPETMMQELPYDIGSDIKKPYVILRCYPNEAIEESPGTPFTRLVIEGEVRGITYYWPLEINRDDGGNGIARNCRYVFDIRIGRLGNTDPDIPVKAGDADITMNIQPWEEKDGYGVRF